MTKLKIRALREHKFMSIQELSDKSGLRRATIIDIEKNRRYPKKETAEKLAKALEVSLDDLFEDDLVKSA